jgi:hypothetical protein
MRAPLVLAALAALVLAPPPGVAEAAERGGRAWYVPDHAKLQLAGNVGFLSPGVGYTLLGRRLEVDALLGWVPEAIGGSDILSVTAKVTGRPLAVRVRGVEWRPLSLGVQVTYTFGDQYFVRPPSQFPGKYYDFPTSLRAGIAVGTSADVRVGDRRVGAYAELVALDVMLKAWADNRGALSAADVFSLAVGLRTDL